MKARIRERNKPLPNGGGAVDILGASGGRIAQSVEQRTENPCVPGSIPGPATTFRIFNRIRGFTAV